MEDRIQIHVYHIDFRAAIFPENKISSEQNLFRIFHLLPREIWQPFDRFPRTPRVHEVENYAGIVSTRLH